MCLMEMELRLGEFPHCLTIHAREPMVRWQPGTHTQLLPARLPALTGSTVVISSPGPEGQEEFPSPVPELAKAVGLSGDVFLALALQKQSLVLLLVGGRLL